MPKGTAPASLNAIEPHKFKEGNKAGHGNPLARQVNQLRSALAKAVTRKDVEDIAHGLLKKAKAGDVAAARELFDRIFGKANQPISLTGDARKAARALTAAFNHARYAELFRASRLDGRRADPADDN